MTDGGAKIDPTGNDSSKNGGDVETGRKPYDASKFNSSHSVATSTKDGRTSSVGGGTTTTQQPPSTPGGASFSTSPPPPPPSSTTAPPMSAASAQPISELTEEEREKLKAQDMTIKSRLCSKFCSRLFVLLFLLLIVARLQGAMFSSFWISSPYLLFVSIYIFIMSETTLFYKRDSWPHLFFSPFSKYLFSHYLFYLTTLNPFRYRLGLFYVFLDVLFLGVTEVPTDGIDFENSPFAYTNLEHGSLSTKPTTNTAAPASDAQNNSSPTLKFAPPVSNTQNQATSSVDSKNVLEKLR